jgi:hypothetical protein
VQTNTLDAVTRTAGGKRMTNTQSTSWPDGRRPGWPLRHTIKHPDNFSPYSYIDQYHWLHYIKKDGFDGCRFIAYWTCLLNDWVCLGSDERITPEEMCKRANYVEPVKSPSWIRNMTKRA